ncbi:hypothetical protein Bxe_A3390 [Paraburkholderia xenovorans LB400]|uniref:Uncharacterized protein n=1 Tax=Paraburkholderia xenovorans (strain LB400) TaxID=266265 RepID=Q142Z4_PARXL|nr:hypothetical protein Bxe_A3390 [Paraburkholderia xenovorans LB400]
MQAMYGHGLRKTIGTGAPDRFINHRNRRNHCTSPLMRRPERSRVAPAQRLRTAVCRWNPAGLAPRPRSGKIPPFSRLPERPRRTGSLATAGRDAIAAHFSKAPGCADASNGAPCTEAETPSGVTILTA